MLKHDSLCPVRCSRLAVLLRAIVGWGSVQVKYFTLYGDDFYSIVQYSKPSSLFKKQEEKTSRIQHFLFPPPLYNCLLK